MRGLLPALAFVVLVAAGTFGALSGVAEPAKIAEGAEAVDTLDAWRTRVREARDRVRAARSELAAAEYAYADWNQRKRPRGTPKGEIVARIARAEQEVEAAEAALPEVVEDARRAGLEPGDFRALEVDP